MIILLGPDGTGKTTLAHRLEEEYGMLYSHYTKDSGYYDYLKPMCRLEWTNAVLDRHAICEFAYAKVMKRQFKFTLKQWHNILLMTLIQSPLIVLCGHKPNPLTYPSDQYLPYDRWDECMKYYKSFLSTHHITHITYDYLTASPNFSEYVFAIQENLNLTASWWRRHWEAGYGCGGSTKPDFLLVAERIGPNNANNIPFETGPTGHMLSEMLSVTGTPLGKLAVTNMVKSFRRDARHVNARDVELLEEEIVHLKPKKVIFMGSPARRGIPVAKALGCETGTLVHLGSLNYRGVKDMSGYYNEWRKLIGIVPTVSFKEE